MTRSRNIIKYILPSLLLSFMIISCDKNTVYDKFKDIKDGEWLQSEPVKFDVQIDDTVSWYKVFISTRNNGDYKFSNLFIFITTNYPDGKISRDTIDCLLADEKGKWLGKGIGDRKDCQYLIKKGVKFNQAGIYTFVLEQAMREPKLEGIESIGVRVEKMK